MNEETLFERALQLPTDQRAAFLERECSDPVLRQRVLALLAADAGAESSHEPERTEAYEPPPPAGTGGSPCEAIATRAVGRARPEPQRSSATELGTVIAGRYTLLQKIGEGGMGSVYLASQSEPVKRQVALKVIKTGRDSKAVLARFDAERQALALMDHPNIARIYDGGVTQRGEPFFVMELVHGIPLNEFCDQKRLSIEARLQLFVPICQVVQHAHQKGIIHRDLKPSNVLVIEVDGRPTPKVIDFGVAKATEQKLTDQSFEEVGAIVGTPAYMSPEQADPTSMDIDTRTDVYALGVMLYELLAGSPPIDAKQFKRGAILEMLRMVREVEPPRPSTKLSSSENLPTIAANRQIEPARLAKLLRGELDWVVLKAIEKDRTRRYETANGLARDIQRYLADEVVEARPPSRGYRLRKFVQRNKVQVLAASLVVLALVGGMIGTTWGLLQARLEAEQKELARADEARQRALAELAAEQERQAKLREAQRAESERLAKQQAERNLAYATKGNELLGSVFAGLDPKANYATVAEFRKVLQANLAKSVKELEGSAIGEPLTVAAMQNTLGQSLLGLGGAKLAVEVFEKAMATRQAKLGPDHPSTLTSMNNLASGYHDAGQLDRALPLYEETLKLSKAKLGPDHPDTLGSMNNLALGYQAAGQLAKALPLYEQTLKLSQAKLGPDHPNTLVIMANLSQSYRDAGKLDKALKLETELLQVQSAKLGAEHPQVLQSTLKLGMELCEVKQADQAVPLLRRFVAAQRPRFAEDDPDFAAVLARVGQKLLVGDQFTAAEQMLRECLAIREKREPDGWTTFNTRSMLGGALLGQKKYAEAEPLLLKGYEGMKAREKTIPPEGSTRIPEALDRLIELYTATNKPDEVQKYKDMRAMYPAPEEPAPQPKDEKK